MTLQLVNVYLLLAALAVICCWTTHASIARRYLAALSLADYGHIWACYVGVGLDLFLRPAEVCHVPKFLSSPYLVVTEGHALN